MRTEGPEELTHAQYENMPIEVDAEICTNPTMLSTRIHVDGVRN
jgi:hypothetical protein